MMKRSKIALCVLAVTAIVAVSTALAVTQLYVDPYFKYKGHWVFNTASGADVRVLVQNVTGSTKGVRIDFSAGLLYPTATQKTIGTTVYESIAPGQTKEIRFSLPAQVTSLNFLRIRRFP